MDSLVTFLNNNPVAALFLIISIGTFLGQLSIRGVTLGASTVLFVAMAFGHLGLRLAGEFSTFGVVLFVYAVGLQAGPRFFKSFRRRGATFALIAVATPASAMIAAWAMNAVFDLGAPLTAGIYAGAMTTTPGLAAALDTLKDPAVSVGYGIAYPVGVVGIVLFVQVLPRLLRHDLKAEGRAADAAARGPAVTVQWLEVRNPQLHNRTVGDFLSVPIGSTTISRITKLGHTIPARNEAVFELGDRVRAVGTVEDLARLEMMIGPKIDGVVEPPSQIESRTLMVTEDSVSGKSLSELGVRERYGIVVTRLWRDDNERVPTGATTLEIGDTIRIVGDRADCERFVPLVGHQERKLQETRFLPLSMGLLLGVVAGTIALPMPGSLSLKLGLAGGPLLIALLAGHFGRIGHLSFRVPLAAKYFIRELGLLFFLATAGVSAGAHFVEVFREHGPALIAAGVVIKLVGLSVSFGLARRALKLDMLTSLGLTCGCLTSTPGLGVVTAASDSESPALAYATVYPMALIAVTMLTQALALLLLAAAT